ncbi:MAG: PIN domain-containing protein [Actinomycetota bacterium]
MQSPRVALDSTCLIGYLQGDPTYAPLTSYFDAALKKEIILVISAVALMESQIRSDDSNADAMRKIFNSDLIEIVDLGRNIVEVASLIMGKHNMKNMDAAIVATAIISNCDVLISNDSDFPYDEKITNAAGNVIRISRPEQYGTPELDFGVSDE